MRKRRPVPFDGGRPGDRLQLLPRVGDLPERGGRLHRGRERARLANRPGATIIPAGRLRLAGDRERRPAHEVEGQCRGPVGDGPAGGDGVVEPDELDPDPALAGEADPLGEQEPPPLPGDRRPPGPVGQAQRPGRRPQEPRPAGGSGRRHRPPPGTCTTAAGQLRGYPPPPCPSSMPTGRWPSPPPSPCWAPSGPGRCRPGSCSTCTWPASVRWNRGSAPWSPSTPNGRWRRPPPPTTPGRPATTARCSACRSR